MRILHTEWSDGWGGQERRVMADLTGMTQRGHQVVLATRPLARIGIEAEKAGIPVIRLPMRRNADLASAVRLARYLKTRRIQVVNTHSGVDTWIGSLAAKLARVPVLVRTRHLDLPLKRTWSNFVHYLPDIVVACGQTMRSHLVEGCGFPAEKVVSIPTGVPFDRFVPQRDRAAVRKEIGIGEDVFMILMVGIIRGVKRHEIAVRALKQVLADVPGSRLVLAGEGPMRRDMEELAQSLAISDHVYFLGQRDDVADLMNAADVLLLTSRSEGVPQAVTQALGLGLPVVATAVGGVPELVVDGECGVLVAPESIDQTAAALSRIARDKAAARNMGAKGQAHVHRLFSLDAMLTDTEALYLALLRKKEPR